MVIVTLVACVHRDSKELHRNVTVTDTNAELRLLYIAILPDRDFTRIIQRSEEQRVL